MFGCASLIASTGGSQSYSLGSFLNYDIFSMRPFRLNYDLPPNLNFADVGRLLLLRYQMIHFEVLLLYIVNLI